MFVELDKRQVSGDRQVAVKGGSGDPPGLADLVDLQVAVLVQPLGRGDARIGAGNRPAAAQPSACARSLSGRRWFAPG